jgi:hypothetical protein
MYDNVPQINLESILKQYLNGEQPHYEPTYLKIDTRFKGLNVCDMFGSIMRL